MWRAAVHPNKPWQPSAPTPCTHISVSGFPRDASRLPSDTRLIRDAPAWPEADNAFSLPAAPPSPPEVRDGQGFYSSPGSKTSSALLVNLLCSLTRVRHNILILKSWSKTKTKQEPQKTPQWAPVPVWKKINSPYAPIARAQRCPLFQWKLCHFSAPITCIAASILALHWLMNKPQIFTVSRRNRDPTVWHVRERGGTGFMGSLGHGDLLHLISSSAVVTGKFGSSLRQQNSQVLEKWGCAASAQDNRGSGAAGSENSAPGDGPWIFKVGKVLQGRTPGPSWGHSDLYWPLTLPYKNICTQYKTKPKMSGFFQHILNHLWNIINLKYTFPLQGVRITWSPEAFVSSEVCNACRSPFSPEERDLRGPCNGYLFVCGINLFICYTLIINQHLVLRQYKGSHNQPCSITHCPARPLQNPQMLNHQTGSARTLISWSKCQHCFAVLGWAEPWVLTRPGSVPLMSLRSQFGQTSAEHAWLITHVHSKSIFSSKGTEDSMVKYWNCTSKIRMQFHGLPGWLWPQQSPPLLQLPSVKSKITIPHFYFIHLCNLNSGSSL